MHLCFGGYEMQKLMKRALTRYGITARVETKTGEQTTKVFFRSVKSEAQQSTERVFSPLGEIPRGRYICILPAQPEPKVEGTLTVHGKRYLLRQIEPVTVGEEMMCRWCLCVEKGDDEWS